MSDGPDNAQNNFHNVNNVPIVSEMDFLSEFLKSVGKEIEELKDFLSLIVQSVVMPPDSYDTFIKQNTTMSIVSKTLCTCHL